jgi:hypothetical protein
MTIRQTCRDRVNYLVSTPTSSTWSVNCGWFLVQVVFAVCAIYLSAPLPAPGIAIAVLGLLAVVATFEHEPSSFQRAFWIIIATGLLVIEIHAVAEDRLENQGDQAYARAVDQTHFLKTAKSLQTAIKTEEEQTTKEQIQFRETLARFNDLVNTETGGNSFFYLSFSELYGGRTFDLKAIKKGRYPHIRL